MPLLLDLFCGVGGAAMGYHRAGFEVVGVDIAPQPNYPFEFHQDHALKVLEDWLLGGNYQDGTTLTDFDAIHASPPCQAHSAMKVMWNAREHEDLVAQTRALLRASGLPYVIENVEGAPLENPVRICGSALGLGSGDHELRRHRLFETNWALLVPPCAHGQRPRTIGIYGDHARDRRRVEGRPKDRGYDFPNADGRALGREAMEMPWADWNGLSQAVPPAYTELIGHQLLSYVRGGAARSA